MKSLTHPSAAPEARKRIVDLVVWNQRMEGIPSSRGRVAAMYDKALNDPLVIPGPRPKRDTDS